MRREALHHLLVDIRRSGKRNSEFVQILLEVQDILRIRLYRGFRSALLVFQPCQKESGIVGKLGGYGFDASHGRTS